ncbi:NACHT domain-containing protein [Streptomyces sp. NPDC020480]|uniref:NACHT domain-containing protein n=1 Tax=Streptomyces sp. NPDC020480 TaxID=3365076 RepID=UPI0037879948
MLFLAAEIGAGLLPDIYKAVFGEKPRNLAVGAGVTLILAALFIYIRYLRSRAPLSQPEISPEHLERVRSALLHRVHHAWTRDIDHRWEDAVRIELGLEDSPAAVHDPWGSRRLTSASDTSLPQGTKMRDVFEQHGRQLLVLGSPGAGKTVHMLELAAALIDEAQADEGAPIPVFLLLTNWRGETMKDWIIEEAQRRYRVSPDATGTLLSQAGIYLILDGLDEVNPERHEECVAQINRFLSVDGYPQCGIAVSCRAADYDRLTERLTVNGAVTVQSIPVRVVHAFLDAAGTRLQGLRAAAAADPELARLLTTPLMMGVAAMAYSGVGEMDVYSSGTLDERRGLIYEAFLEKMISRDCSLRGDGIPSPYSLAQVSGRLIMMARMMNTFHATVLYPADPTRMMRQAPSKVLDDVYTGISGRVLTVLISRYSGRSFPASSRAYKWLWGYSPFLLPKFIDFACERALLRRSGDGVAFIHKTFQDHLVRKYEEASMDEKPEIVRQSKS